MNDYEFESISQNGLCNVFASIFALKHDLDIHMIAHDNPDWDEPDQTEDDMFNMINSPNVMIIHCVIADINGDCFDSNGYIFDDYGEIINDLNTDYDSKLIRTISQHCSHGDLNYEDPFTVIDFTAKELIDKINSEPERYDMNKPDQLLESSKIQKYYDWINKFDITNF